MDYTYVGNIQIATVYSAHGKCVRTLTLPYCATHCGTSYGWQRIELWLFAPEEGTVPRKV